MLMASNNDHIALKSRMKVTRHALPDLTPREIFERDLWGDSPYDTGDVVEEWELDDFRGKLMRSAHKHDGKITIFWTWDAEDEQGDDLHDEEVARSELQEALIRCVTQPDEDDEDEDEDEAEQVAPAPKLRLVVSR